MSHLPPRSPEGPDRGRRRTLEIAVQYGIETEQIWLDLHTRLQSFIRRRVASQNDAEDILQDVFTRIHTNLHRLNDEQSVTGWVYQITRNAIIDHYRARARDVGAAGRASEAAVVEGPVDQAAGDDEDRADPSGGLGACVQPLLGGLPEHYRQAIELTELQGLTQRAAAEREGLSVPGMKARVQRGRRKLKDLLLDCCHVELDRRGGVVDVAPRSGARCDSCGCGTSEPRGN